MPVAFMQLMPRTALSLSDFYFLFPLSAYRSRLPFHKAGIQNSMLGKLLFHSGVPLWVSRPSVVTGKLVICVAMMSFIIANGNYNITQSCIRI